MRELTGQLRGWRQAGTPFALATVVGVQGSAPRQPGAVMAVDAAGEALGSVSGGCVEGAVYEVATEVIATGAPVLTTYGISDDDAFSVGLTCGGVIDVMVTPTSEAMFETLDAIAADVPVALATVLTGPGGGVAATGRQLAVWADRVVGGLGSPGLDHAVVDDARGMLAAGRTGVRYYGPAGERSPVDAAATAPATAPAGAPAGDTAAGTTGERPVAGEPLVAVAGEGPVAGEASVAGENSVAGEGPVAGGPPAAGPAAVGIRADAAGLPADAVTVFVQSFAPPPRMLVFGAVDYAAALVSMGRFLGYRVTVCDARPVFATARRFPDAHEVVCEWPSRYLERVRVDERTVICVLTHDPKFDVPVLRVALRSPAGYVGAMGSRRTHEDRLRRLREAGLTEDALARLRSPIGLDIGGRTPEETAVSIAAEIIQMNWGGSGAPLGHTSGRIHGPAAVPAG
ncbi:XdhC family protein [Frankia nepalensis]|uniref:XdhC family protein n=1 Tax=Frankia nepalensis TaxID=1836974 RepID=A0A937R9Z4_9ACTN|nr:XdhC/CoxI family protein [Frankia nepalensis]MBL7497061.1 XdhC family protein [Frankia nepalensis]MBL7513610.1 XdhC family protein [Frankia nepalensis]MBL7626452.1 XdhC family protein [Frankia nepalensis]